MKVRKSRNSVLLLYLEVSLSKTPITSMILGVVACLPAGL